MQKKPIWPYCGFHCHRALLYIHAVLADQINTCLNNFKGLNNFSTNQVSFTVTVKASIVRVTIQVKVRASVRISRHGMSEN